MKNTPFKLVALMLAGFLLVGFGVQTAVAQREDFTGYKKIMVKPSETNPDISAYDQPHIVFHDPALKKNKILLWMAGTGGTTNSFPVKFLKTALEQGYRVVIISYITEPAVAQTCIGKVLTMDPGCAVEYRRKRTYGDDSFSLIPDKPQDAIIARFVKLLAYLSKTDAEGEWNQYLDAEETKPNWSMIALAGQSQGGGMAEFIAQNENVFRVVSFSGGWDYSNSTTKKIADWYYNKNTTPMANWYVTYNINEAEATSIGQIAVALKIPADHVFALDKPLMNPNNSSANPYHSEGIKNPAYKDVWLTMLGSGR